MSESLVPKQGDKKEELRGAVEQFLRRNGFTMTPDLEWTDELELSFTPSCANNNYTLAVVMLQALYVDTMYGYIAYRKNDTSSFKICFRKYDKTIEQHIEYVNRAEVSVKLRYKGELV